MKSLSSPFVCLTLFGLALSILAPRTADAQAAKLKYSCDSLEVAQDTETPMTQGLDGWFFRTRADLHEDFYLSEETKGYFRRFVAAAKRRGITLVFVPIPPRGLLANQYLHRQTARQIRYDPVDVAQTFSDYIRELRSTGLVVPDLLEAAQREKSISAGFFFRRDSHWTPLGARITARAVRAQLNNLDAYTNLQTTVLKSEVRSKSKLKMWMADEIQRFCVGTIPAEAYTEFETRVSSDAKKSPSDNSDLFGSEGGAGELVLLGTSYSGLPQFNFDGFLSEASGLIVANHAISGGGAYNSLLSYLSSPNFVDASPPLVVWEVPSYVGLNGTSPAAFRQAIAALHGPCDEASALASSESKLSPGEKAPVLLELKPEQRVSGSKFYMHLSTDNLAFARFTLKIDYADGDFEWFYFDRSNHFDNQGQFFVEFSDDVKSDVAKVALTSAPESEMRIGVRVCAAPETNGSTISGA